MNKVVGLTLGMSLIAGLVLTSAGCASALGETNQSPLSNVADNFIRNSSTFKFDGYANSVKISNPVQKPGGTVEYTVEYQTGQPGHGDRSGQMLPQLVTNHTAIIDVRDSTVATAVCDDEWDIKADKMTGPGMETMPAGQNVTDQDGSLFAQTVLAGENVTPGVDLAAR